ncbi:MAG: hypothetical protein AB8G18_12420 [Gammaproteobacteria bacterium]
MRENVNKGRHWFKLIALSAVLVSAQSSLGAGTDPGGTAAGNTVSNQATLDYQVGGVSQTQVLSDNDGNPINGNNATTFVVDRKLDSSIVERSTGYNSATTPTVGPGMAQGGGSTGAVLAYTLTNEGNEVQDFTFTATATTFDPFGGTDNFDATNVNVFVDADGDGVYDPAVDTATFVDELDYVGNAGGNPSSIVVFVVGDIPIGRVNGDIAAYVLNAQVAEGGAAGVGADITSDDSGTADDPATVQDVFADGANANNGADADRDGISSIEDAFLVGAPELSIAKSSGVIADPFTCPGFPVTACPGGANPKAIPGGIIEYTITVSNAPGSASATSINVADDLTSEILGGGGTEAIDFVSGQYGGNDIELTTIVGGVPTVTNLTAASDGDVGQFVANVLAVSVASLAAGDSAEVRFRVEIQ